MISDQSRRRRDEEFTAFVTASARALRRTAYLIVGDWHLAEDVVQTALVRMYGHWGRIQPELGPGPYARKAVVNTAISELRRGRRRETSVADVPDASIDMATVSQIEAALEAPVVAALRGLAPRQRAVLVLRYVEDLSVERTADVLGVSEGTVKSQSSKGLSALRRVLELDGDVLPVQQKETSQ